MIAWKGGAGPAPKEKLRSRVNYVLLTLLRGTMSPSSSLYALRRFRSSLLRSVWLLVARFYADKLEICSHASHHMGLVQFPPFRPCSVNMMPFLLGSKDSLPLELHTYWPLIATCRSQLEPQDWGAHVAYLTVDCRVVQGGTSHRRGRLHTETPGAFRDGSGELVHERQVGWGGGTVVKTHVRGGIFIASSVARSTAVYKKVLIRDPHLVVGPGGDCEHVRPFLRHPPALLAANELIWITDCTPHESCKVPKRTERQFFRLIVGECDEWNASKSTPNPTGVVPPAHVRIIE